MKLDWARVIGCGGSLALCLVIWAALGVMAVNWYMHR